jgi:hypothetical protein
MSARAPHRHDLSKLSGLSGILSVNIRSICSMVVSPNGSPCHTLSSRDRKGPSRMIPKSPPNPAAVASFSADRVAPPTLLSVLAALEHRLDLSPNRRRDIQPQYILTEWDVPGKLRLRTRGSD